MFEVKNCAKKISDSINEAITYNNYKVKLEQEIKRLKSKNVTKEQLFSITGNKNPDELLESYRAYILRLLNNIKEQGSQIYKLIEPDTPIPVLEKKLKRIEPSEKKEVPKYQQEVPKNLKLIPEIQISQQEIKRFIKLQKSKKTLKSYDEEFSTYKPHKYAEISNKYMENTSFNLSCKYPQIFDPLRKALLLSNTKLLSRTYISVILFTTLISLPIAFAVSYLLGMGILLSIIITIIAAISTAVVSYVYPFSVINQRKRKIKIELIFATVHMAAVAGSGAQPSKIFKLLVESGEYKELESELKKILNHINLFGYNLSTALRAVAKTTPSYEFKELLNGMVSTIESGGELKKYLNDKADDALTMYRLDQQKHVSAIQTYSDIYTGILIAAPLLFIVTLAILDKIAPTINLGSSEISVATIATFGTFLFLPVINVAFIVLLNILQPEI